MQPHRDFSHLYCERQGIDSRRYVVSVFNRALHPHARPLAWMLRRLIPGYFRADYDLIQDVGGIRRLTDYEQALAEFAGHPANRHNPLRALFLIRVGPDRLRRIVRKTLLEAADMNPT